MASYASTDEYVAAFGEREAIRTSAIDNPSATAVDESRLQVALDDASDEIDSYLNERYNVADIRANTPRRLVRICLDIARYTLTKNRPPEDYRQRYEDAIAWLKDVAKGIAGLGLTTDNEEAVTDGGKPVYQAMPRIFTRDRLRSL